VAARRQIFAEKGHKFRVSGLAVSPLDDYALSVGPDHQLCLWRLPQAAE
jgi:hypothetical protein